MGLGFQKRPVKTPTLPEHSHIVSMHPPDTPTVAVDHLFFMAEQKVLAENPELKIVATPPEEAVSRKKIVNKKLTLLKTAHAAPPVSSSTSKALKVHHDDQRPMSWTTSVIHDEVTKLYEHGASQIPPLPPQRDIFSDPPKYRCCIPCTGVLGTNLCIALSVIGAILIILLTVLLCLYVR